MLAAQIADALDREVELEVHTEVSGPPPHDNPFESGEVDLGWMCSAAYVRLSSVEQLGVAWVPDDADSAGRPVYFSDVIAPGLDLCSVEDLRDKRIACSDRASLSGFYALRFALDERGIDLDEFAELHFTGGHIASMDAVEAGAFDATLVDSVTRSVERPQLMPALRLGPFPTQPLVAGPAVSHDDRDRIRQALLANSAQLTDALAAAGLRRFAPVDEASYDPIRRAARL